MRYPALLLVLAIAPAHALLIRADRDDSEYVELATKYASAVPLGAGLGEGVLVAPRWVLTTAHRAAVLRDLAPRPQLRVGSEAYAIEAIAIHPGWKGGREDDVALVKLARPVQGVEPTPVHRVSDEAGRVFAIVAHGPTGKLGMKVLDESRRRRAAINTVDDVQPKLFAVTIKGGDDASDLQGAALREETGAPAYLADDDGITVAGVLASVEEARGDAPSGSVGERETFTRVSAYAAWIDATMRE